LEHFVIWSFDIVSSLEFRASSLSVFLALPTDTHPAADHMGHQCNDDDDE